MFRLLWTLVRVALLVAVIAIVRSVLLDRAPRRALHGDEPVIGSLDTWPEVPRQAGRRLTTRRPAGRCLACACGQGSVRVMNTLLGSST